MSRLALAAALAFLLFLPLACSAQPRDPWAEVTTPTRGVPQIYGGYAHGCIAGAVPLPLDGPGYAVVHPQRHRNYGHPELIRFIERLGRRARAAGLPDFYVADMAQPRGGPLPYAHASHQIGIDADIELDLDPALKLTSAARADFEPPSMLLASYHAIDPHEFGKRQIELLKLAATDPEVARIFVNPVIKEALCRSVLGSTPEQRAWLRNIRPWFGHAAHFHVRLKCPDSSPYCENQKPPPPGDGCGAELQSWLRHLPPPPPVNKPHPMPVLPAACHRVLDAR